MKTFIYCITMLLTKASYGQIIYEPVFIDQCTGEGYEGHYWYMFDSTNVYWVDTLEMKKVILPKKGNYKLSLGIEDRPLKISVNHNEVRKDTFFMKRLTLTQYVSNPPTHEYNDCGQLAQGKVVDYYYSGNVRMRGTFEAGQEVDSVFTYYRSGAIDKLFIPRKKDWKRITFFEDGQVKSVFDTKKRFSKEFYSNGKLKEESYWSKKYKSFDTEYYLSGALKMKRNNKKQEIYDQRGILRERIMRKEILKMGRIFAINAYDRRKFYEYRWELFDSEGLLERKIIFNGSDFSMNHFPDSMEQIENFLYNEVVFYKKGKEYKKVNLRLDEDEATIEVLSLYYKKQKKWMEAEN